MHHLKREDWLMTPEGDARGYIQPQLLRELWFHTGTTCNLSCPFCLEGSKPGDNRLQQISFADAKDFIDEALNLGVEQLSFTGGEPFVIKDMIKILDYALNYLPCLILTNATEPLMNRMYEVLPLKYKPNQLSLRVSIDYPDPEKHDAGRGKGNFNKVLKTLGYLYKQRFPVSIARQETQGENREEVNRSFWPYLQKYGLPKDLNIVVFPDFLPPGAWADVPHITENCMTKYKNENTRAEFMCHYSKMVMKKDGKMRVYACTLVDDDEDYDLGENLKEAMKIRVMLKHHRCYSCFASGASCSELKFQDKENLKDQIEPMKISI
jgi:MoaA/NifB/PqqE/SkfB family radical SAM enzyme